MIVSQYFIVARLMPAVICSAPLLLLYFSFLRASIGPFFDAFLKVQWLGDISTAAVLMFLLAMVGRTIAKDIFERRWFRSDETKMPTTEFMLYSSGEYSNDFKTRLRGKLNRDFGVHLPTAQQEAADEHGARKQIAETVGLMRKKVKDGHLLLQHNIEYGFVRNLIGGSVVAVLASVANILIFQFVSPNPQALVTSIVMGGAYLLPLLLSKPLVHSYGKRYARVLFQEYLSD